MKFTFLLLLFSVVCFGQNTGTKKDPVPELFLTDSDIIPEFKGGHGAMLQYFRDSVISRISIRPEESSNVRSVFARFKVSESGKVSEVSIIRSSNIARIDSLYESALKHMPDWSPGTTNGKAQSMFINLPLKIELR